MLNSQLPVRMMGALLLTACASAIQFSPAPHGGERIPFRLNKNHIIVDVSVGRGTHGQVAMILDSGADISLFDLAVLDAASVRSAEPIKSDGLGTSADVRIVGDVQYSLGSLHARNATVATTSLTALSEREGLALGGILGGDFLRSFVVEIDYQRLELVVHAPSDRPPRDGYAELSLITRDDRPFVRGALAVASTVVDSIWQLDTGTSGAVIVNGPVVRDFSLAEGATETREAASVVGATKFRQRRAARFTLGNCSVAQPVVDLAEDTVGVLARRNNAGIVGGDILRRFRLILDMPHDRLWIRPASAEVCE